MQNKKTERPDIDFIVSRLVNQTGSAEGSILPPRVVGSLRIPIVSNLRILRTQSYFGGTQFSLAWDEPTRALNIISHFNVYVLGLLTNNAQPLGPFTTRRSPAEIRVQAETATTVTFVVQTVLLNGQVSDIANSPSVSGFTVGGGLTSSDYSNSTIPTTALIGIAGQLITWDASNLGTTIGPGTSNNILVGAGAGAEPVFKSRTTLDLVEGRSALTSTNQIPKVTSSGILGQSGISDDGTKILVPSRVIGIKQATPTAYLHLGAGTATAETAPIKITAGTNLTVPEAGALEYDGTRLYLTPTTVRRTVELMGESLSATQTVANTLTETTVFTDTIPANSTKAGSVYKARTFGFYSTVNASDTFTIRWKIDGTTILSVQSTAANVTDRPIDLEAIFTIYTIGATGTVIGYAVANLDQGNKSTSNTTTTVIDTTSDLPVTVTIEWDAADPGNTVSITQGFLELKS